MNIRGVYSTSSEGTNIGESLTVSIGRESFNVDSWLASQMADAREYIMEIPAESSAKDLCVDL